MDLEDLSVIDRLFAIADLAAVLLVDYLAFATAIGTRLLDLLDHGSQLSEHNFDTLATAARTLTDRTFLAALAITFGAKDVLLECQFRRFPFVKFFRETFTR